MTESELIHEARKVLEQTDRDAALALVQKFVSTHEQRNRHRREREQLLKEYMARYNMSLREAKALLTVERPDHDWKQH